MLHKPIDAETMITKSDLTIVQLSYVTSDFVNLRLKSNHSLKLTSSALKTMSSTKQALTSLLIDNCSNKSKPKPSASSTATTKLKIEMTGPTRLLLVKRDFEHEYEQLVNEYQRSMDSPNLAKRVSLFHQVYTLFLLLINDIDKLIELNESSRLKSNPFGSKMTEVYLTCLNYLYYRENSMSKFKYKTKVYRVLEQSCLGQTGLSRSFLDLVRLTLIRLKLDTSTALVNQIVESSDTDAMFARLVRDRCSILGGQFAIAHVCAHLVRVERVLRENFGEATLSDELTAVIGGFDHQIRRLFEAYTKARPLDAQLWLLFFRFESSRLTTRHANQQQQQKRLLAIYYQSIQNLPYHKVKYLNLVYLRINWFLNRWKIEI